MKKNCIFICLAALIVFSSSVLFAEDAPKGFKVTENTTLDVGINITPEYDSNIKKVSKDNITTQTTTTTKDGAESSTTKITSRGKDKIVDAFALHLSPSLRIKFDDSNTTFGFSALFDYTPYFGKDTDGYYELSLRSDLIGEFNKKGLVMFDFKNTLSRSSNPDSEDLDQKHNNLLDSFAIGLAFKNSEDILYGKIKFGVDVNYLEESKDKDVYKDYNYYSLLGDFFGRWKFLPKTMAFFSVAARYQEYYESSLPDAWSVPVNAYLGVMGQVSPHFSGKLSAGYSVNAGKSAKHDYNANAEIIFKHNDTGALLGYLRSMRPSSYYRYNSSHKLYFTFKQKFAKKFLAAVNLNYSIIDYGKNISYNNKGTYQNNKKETVYNERPLEGWYVNKDDDPIFYIPSENRRDHFVIFTPSLGYSILPWLGLKLSYNLEYKKAVTKDGKDTYFQVSQTYNSDKTVKTTTETHYNYMDHRVMLAIILDY